jgi:hypothetical protein
VKYKPALLSLALVLSIAGCRGDDDDNPGADSGPDGDDTTVYQVQDEAMPVGTPVTLRDVVVTAVDTFGGRTGGIYVMEPAGGPFSGVFVFLRDATAANLQPGDLVDVEGGVKDEFALSEDDSGRTLTEVSPPQNGAITITKVGDGSIPAPEVLLPQDLAADDAEAEKWEGVLVKFENVRALNAPQGSTQSDPTLNDFDITGPFNVQSSLVELPTGIARDDCFTEMVGIVDYFFDYKLLPRVASDVGGTGSGCLALEDNDALCGDGADNDFNGFADCADLGCIPATVACPVADSNVADVQALNGVAVGERVALTGVVVTAIDTNGSRNDFFVQDVGSDNGIFVLFFDDLPPNLSIGSTLDIQATITLFDMQIVELTQPIVTNVVAAGLTPGAVTNQTATALQDITTGEAFEGSLVTLQNISVVDASLMFGKVEIGESATPLIMDDDLVGLPMLDTGDCLTSVTGVMHWNTIDDHRSLLPRSAADVDLTPGICN